MGTLIISFLHLNLKIKINLNKCSNVETDSSIKRFNNKNNLILIKTGEGLR